jgi:serine/threonine-protein kinase
MLANVSSAQILIAESIYERVKDVPGFQFNPRPVREAGETFGTEAIYELLWTDESTYGHLRQASGGVLKAVGRYQVQEELGRGAMGAVYKAYDELIGRTVALKTISIDRHTPERDELIDRLKQEAKAAGGLDHPNIITIYDVGQEDDVVYLSMQFVKGITLATLLTDAGVPALQTFVSWADQITGAVGFAHARGVIHRDLKPANLMVTEDGVIKVLDFGIAKIENASLTQTGLVMGTPSYMSPEQVAGKKVDHRADIFALGSVFYELLTSEKPFRGDVPTILYKIVYEDPVAPSLVNPAVPGGIDAIVRKALAKDPKERFQSCEDMRKAFLEQAAGLNVTVSGRSTAETPIAKPAPLPADFSSSLFADAAPQRPSIRWPIVMGLAVALVGTTTWAFYTHSYAGVLSQLKDRFARTFYQTSVPISNSVERDKSSGQPFHTGTNDPKSQNSAVNEPTNPGIGSGTPGSGAPNTAGPETRESAESSGASTAPSQEESASQSLNSQPASDGIHTATATAVPLSGHTETQSPDQTLVSASPAVAQQGNNQPAVTQSAFVPKGAAANGDLSKAVITSRAESGTATKSLKQPRTEAQMVDGFTRHDIPELVRQAETAAQRGNYRLALYEYNLILKLDRNNTTARSGLRRVQDAEQSH